MELAGQQQNNNHSQVGTILVGPTATKAAAEMQAVATVCSDNNGIVVMTAATSIAEALLAVGSGTRTCSHGSNSLETGAAEEAGAIVE